ncbi:MAG: hypothetical protein LQ338_000894 [Usnochroma carphineum]|nr:MAG: hypothetical protein LQ338_000894 [Usnochroma carphineum]
MIRNAADTVTGEVSQPLQEIGQGQGPDRVAWRSRVDNRPLDLKNKFSDQFAKDNDVYVNGARGSIGPFKVDAVLGNGKYKLRKENGEKMKRIYDEGNLSLQPKLA